MKDFEYDGTHLLIDAICDNSKKLSNQSKVVVCLEEIVRDIGMTMILPPITVKFPHTVSEIDRIYADLKSEGLGSCKTAKIIKANLQNRKEKLYGYSSFVIIAESHISIHTFPEANFFSFDCYSCKKFDSQKVVDKLTQFFKIKNIEVQLIDRALPKAQ